jgi:hypothetical protein
VPAHRPAPDDFAEIPVPPLPDNELWEEDPQRAQEMYVAHTEARAVNAANKRAAARFAKMERELDQLRGGFSNDRRGRLLSAIQTSDRELRANGWDEQHGVLATNPHYTSNPEVKQRADYLIQNYLEQGVRFAAQTGENSVLRSATSKKGLRQALLLAMDEAGYDLLGGGTPTARISGAALAGSAGAPGPAGSRRPFTDEEREVKAKWYPHLTDDQFRDQVLKG